MMKKDPPLSSDILGDTLVSILSGSVVSILESGIDAVATTMENYVAAPEAATTSASSDSTVAIGKTADLSKPGALNSGERALDLPDQGSPKANWRQNSGELRKAMHEGKPIRDVSSGKPGSNTGFLRAERDLLEYHGWTLLKGGFWWPPIL
jgi:hypothetical protein